MDTTRQVYMDAAKACGLKDGDAVRVTRAAISHEAGWGNIWVSAMDKYIGCIGTVRDCNLGGAMGVTVIFPGGTLHVFPYFVLEKVEDMPARKFKVGDYVRVLRGWEYGERGVGLSSPGEEVIRMTAGKVGRIKDVSGPTYNVEFPAPINGWWGYPWFALEKAGPEFKPFDKVLVRDNTEEKWVPSLYGYYDAQRSYRHRMLNNNGFRYCIPYEGNEHLLGTTKEA